jgi:hypothetical protein
MDGMSTDIHFQENILLWMLLANGKMSENLVQAGDLVDGGTKIREYLEYGEANSGTYGRDTEISFAAQKIGNACDFRWAGYHASNSISLDERVQNSGDSALVNLVDLKMGNILKTLRKTMGTTIYAAAATDLDFLGLGDLFNATTSVAYGSIKEADMDDWAANVITTSEAMSFSTMLKIRRTATVKQNAAGEPNLYLTTPTLKDGLENSLQLAQRFSDPVLAAAGFDNLLFKRQPVVADPIQASGYCDALNLRFLRIATHKDYAFTTPKWEYQVGRPDNFVANQRWIGQLLCKHRKAHCRHTNLSAPV